MSFLICQPTNDWQSIELKLLRRRVLLLPVRDLPAVRSDVFPTSDIARATVRSVFVQDGRANIQPGAARQDKLFGRPGRRVRDFAAFGSTFFAKCRRFLG